MLLRLGQESGKYGLFNNLSYRFKIMYWKETDTSNFSFENVNGGKGIIQAHKFFTEHSQTGFQFHVWELLPGDSEGIHTHDKKYDYEEIYYIIDGKGMMTINNEEVEVKKGDAILIPTGVEHGLINNGNKLLRLVLLFEKVHNEPQ